MLFLSSFVASDTRVLGLGLRLAVGLAQGSADVVLDVAMRLVRGRTAPGPPGVAEKKDSQLCGASLGSQGPALPVPVVLPILRLPNAISRMLHKYSLSAERNFNIYLLHKVWCSVQSFVFLFFTIRFFPPGLCPGKIFSLASCFWNISASCCF
jgi:hypothetical protein